MNSSDNRSLSRNHGGQKEVPQQFSVLKEENCQPVKLCFRDDGEIKTLLDERKKEKNF